MEVFIASVVVAVVVSVAVVLIAAMRWSAGKCIKYYQGRNGK
jgi:type II secretory pathway component PulK